MSHNVTETDDSYSELDILYTDLVICLISIYSEGTNVYID